MTPAARVSAAIEILDRFLNNEPVERALTNWARANRFAGSGDRAAIRDHVFDVLRSLNSCARRGGGQSGRALMLGWSVGQGLDPDTLFDGGRFAPAPITPAERSAMGAGASAPAPEGEDLPEWLRAQLKDDLDSDFASVAQALSTRAPVFLRVNTLRGGLAAARASLLEDGIAAEPVEGVPTALRVTENPRRLAGSKALENGLIELQDLSPQRAVLALPNPAGLSVLDLCAGGGGKSLALAARGAQVTAHDISAARLAQLGPRAARAGAQIATLPPGEPCGSFDLVVADVPCSGSGTWRRTPEARWRLSAERLRELNTLQDQLLDQAAELTGSGGALAYMTCSVLRAENQDRINDFLARHPDFDLVDMQLILPEQDGGDGFFHALTRRSD